MKNLYLESEPLEFEGESNLSLEGMDWEEEISRSSGDYIRWVQGSLNRIMGLRLAVDGVAGPQTRSAIRSFQQRQRLTVDGIVGSQTEAALIAAGASPPPGASGGVATCPSPTFVDCPVPGTAPTQVLDDFAFNDSNLNRTRHTPLIRNVADQVVASQGSAQPIRSVLIAGHTDPVGSVDFNFGLGRRRAEAVMRELCAIIESKKPGLSRLLRFEVTTCGERQQKSTPEASRRVELFLPRVIQPPVPVPPTLPPAPPRVPPDLSNLIRLVRDILNGLPGLGLIGVKVPTTARFLTPDEQREARTVFGGSLDFTKILISDGLGAQGRPFTVALPLASGFHVVMNMGDVGPWHTRPRSNTLIHELVHGWQSQHHGSDKTAFMKNSVECQARALLDLPAAKASAGAAATAAAVRRGVFDPTALARIAAAAAAAEDVSPYAYIPGRRFDQYAAEQIAEQVEHSYRGIGRPTPSIVTTIQSVGANARSLDNEASLRVISFHRSSTPGVVFP